MNKINEMIETRDIQSLSQIIFEDFNIFEEAIGKIHVLEIEHLDDGRLSSMWIRNIISASKC